MSDRVPEDFNSGEAYTGDILVLDGGITYKDFNAELLWWSERRIFILHNITRGEYITGSPDEMRQYMDLLSGENISKLNLPIGQGPVRPNGIIEGEF